jgi:hypothetical protein
MKKLKGSIAAIFLVSLLFLTVFDVQVASKESFTDSVNDTFDKHNNFVSGEPYLDIIEVNVSSFDADVVATIKVNGLIPTRTEDPSASIEWDVYVDSDLKNVTGLRWPLIINDIGAEYVFRLMLKGDKMTGEVYEVASNKWGNISYEIDGNAVTLHIYKLTSFNYVAATKKFGEGGIELLVADKAPNMGHLTFPEKPLSFVGLYSLYVLEALAVAATILAFIIFRWAPRLKGQCAKLDCQDSLAFKDK